MRTSSKGRRGRTAAAGCLSLLIALTARTAAAQTSAECAPACGAGETCVNGVCMVPAKPPGETPPGAQPAAPESVPPVVPPTPAPPPAPAETHEPEPEAAPQAATVETAKKTPRPAPVAAHPQYAGVPALPDRERQGTVILPYVGLHSFQGSNGSGLNPGLRVGSFVGRYLSEVWSLNGQAELDILNPNEAASTLDASAQMVGVTFSPLVHLGNAKAELVVGPKLGGWIQWKHLKAGSSSFDATLEGWTIGANAGVFTAASPSMRFGGMLSLEMRDILHACGSGTSIPETCSSNGASATILGFTVGVLL